MKKLLAALLLFAAPALAELNEGYAPGRVKALTDYRDDSWIRVASLKPSLKMLFQGVGVTAPGRTVGGGGSGVGSGATGVFTFGSALDAANSITFNETAGCITFEGATANANENLLCGGDASSGDGVYSLPSTGVGAFTIATIEGFQTFSGQNVHTALATFGSALDAANTIRFNETAGCITAEGSGADAFEMNLCFENPPADRTLTFPASTGGVMYANTVVAGGAMSLASGQSIVVPTGANITIGATNGTGLGFSHATTMTPDSSFMWTHTTSESIHVAQVGDVAFDFNGGVCGTSSCTDPTLHLHSRNQSTTEYLSVWHDGVNGHAFAGTGGLLARRAVEASTAGSGAPNVLVATGTTEENDKLITNEGVTAEGYNTLPSAAAGMTFTFYCQDADGIRVTAGAGDTIRLSGSVSAAAGFVRSVTIGSSITLVAINATEWVAISLVGTWTVDV